MDGVKDKTYARLDGKIVDVRTRLVNLRNGGWQPLFGDISFCKEKKIPLPNMYEAIPRWGRSRLDGNSITRYHTFLATRDAIIT